jgi:hypothetical protein
MALALVACASGAAKTPRARPASPSALPPLPPPGPQAVESSTVALPAPSSNEALRLTAIDRATYDRAHELARAGHLREAKRLFAKLLMGYPDRTELADDFNAMQTLIHAAEGIARASLEARTPTVIAPPPAVYTLAHRAPVEPAPIPKVTLRTQAKNKIIDDEAWFRKNEIHRPEYFLPPSYDVFFVQVAVKADNVATTFSGFGFIEYAASARYLDKDFPIWLPTAYGTIPIAHAIDSSPYTIAIYGARLLAVFDEARKARALFDFDAYAHPPANQKGRAKVGEATFTTAGSTPQAGQTRRADIEVETDTISLDLRWALARDRTLFVEHTNRNYAKDNKGQNAYLTAVDLETGDLAWRSAPLVANSETFTLLGGGIVAGYGFTAEPDFIYILDAETGAVKTKTPVPSGPDEIVRNGGSLFVRTYDTDLVFDVK